MPVPYEFLLLILLLATAVVFAYFYLKRAQARPAKVTPSEARSEPMAPPSPPAETAAVSPAVESPATESSAAEMPAAEPATFTRPTTMEQGVPGAGPAPVAQDPTGTLSSTAGEEPDAPTSAEDAAATDDRPS